MKKAVVLIIFLSIGIYGECSDLEKASGRFLGVSGGLGQLSTFSGSAFGGYSLDFLSRTIEVNVGYSYFRNNTDFDGVEDLGYLSHGLFGEGNIFLNSKVYLGVGMSLNMSFVDEESQRVYMQSSTKNPPEIFPGKAMWGQIGFSKNVTKNMSFRIQSQLGLHNYQIETGVVYYSNDHSPVPVAFQDTHAKELRIKALYNIRIGLCFSF